MIHQDSHLLKGWEIEQIGRTTWINKNPVYIKTVNTYRQYECVVVWCDDPCRVNMGQGYRAVNRQNYCDIPPVADGVYSGSNIGRLKQSSPLFLGLILAVNWSPRYKVDGRPGSRSMFDICNGPIGCGSSCYLTGWLPQVPSEVPGPNHLFYHKFEALTVIGLMAIVPVILAS